MEYILEEDEEWAKDDGFDDGFDGNPPKKSDKLEIQLAYGNGYMEGKEQARKNKHEKTVSLFRLMLETLCTKKNYYMAPKKGLPDRAGNISQHSWSDRWFGAWLEIISGTVTILTLGKIQPMFGFDWWMKMCHRNSEVTKS